MADVNIPFISNNVGNIGIGTESPLELFHVSGIITASAITASKFKGDLDGTAYLAISASWASSSRQSTFSVSSSYASSSTSASLANSSINLSQPAYNISVIYASRSFWSTSSSFASSSVTASYVESAVPIFTGKTDNYIPKWSSNTLTGTSNIFDDGTNVGIGTNNPLYSLTVKETANSAILGLIVDNASARIPGVYLINNAAIEGNFRLEQSTESPHSVIIEAGSGGTTYTAIKASGSSVLQLVPVTGLVGIGTTNPVTAKLHVFGHVSASGFGSGSLQGTASYSDRGAVSFTSFYASQSNWAVSSSFASSSITSSYARTSSFYIGTGTTNYLPKWNNNTLTSASLIYDNNINVGVGTGDPTSKLHVLANNSLLKLTRSDITTQYLEITEDASGHGIFGFSPNNNKKILIIGTTHSMDVGVGGAGYIYFNTSGSTKVWIDESGNLLPYVRDAYNLGSVDKSWKNVYGTSSVSIESLTSSFINVSQNSIFSSQSFWSVSASLASGSITSSFAHKAQNALFASQSFWSVSSSWASSSVSSSFSLISQNALFASQSFWAVSASWASSSISSSFSSTSQNSFFASQSFWAVSASWSSRSLSSSWADGANPVFTGKTDGFYPRWSSNTLTGTSLINESSNELTLRGPWRITSGSSDALSTHTELFGSWESQYGGGWSKGLGWVSGSRVLAMIGGFGNASTGVFNYLYFGSGSNIFNAPWMVITNTGNVGVGTTIPQSKLHVIGHVSASGFGSGSLQGTASYSDKTTNSLFASQSFWAVSASWVSSSISSSFSSTSQNSIFASQSFWSVSSSFASGSISSSFSLISQNSFFASQSVWSVSSSWSSSSLSSSFAHKSTNSLFASQSFWAVSASWSSSSISSSFSSTSQNSFFASQSVWSVSSSWSSRSLSSSWADGANPVFTGKSDGYYPKWSSNTLTGTSLINDSSSELTFRGPWRIASGSSDALSTHPELFGSWESQYGGGWARGLGWVSGSRVLAMIGGYGNASAGTFNYLYFGSGSSVYNTPWMVITNTSNVGIGTATPLFSLDLGGTVSGDRAIRISAGGSGNNSSSLLMGTNTREWRVLVNNSAGEYRMGFDYIGGSPSPYNSVLCLGSNSNVGIRTNPTSIDGLTVSGSVKLQGTVADFGGNLIYGTYGSFGETYNSASTIIGNNLIPHKTISDTVYKFASSDNSGSYIQINSMRGIQFFTGITGSINVNMNSFTNVFHAMTVNNRGNVGIGTSTPSYRLDVESTVADWVGIFKNNNNTAASYFAHGSGYGAYIDSGNNSDSSTYALNVNKAGSVFLYVRGDGYIGINASPSTTGQVYINSINSSTAHLSLASGITNANASNVYTFRGWWGIYFNSPSFGSTGLYYIQIYN